MTAPQDPPSESSETINLSHSFAREYWCTRLNTTLSDLKHAVYIVGPKLDDVKRYLAELASQRSEDRKKGKPATESGSGDDPGTTRE